MKAEGETINFLEELCKKRPEFLEMTPIQIIDHILKEKVFYLIMNSILAN